MKMYVGIVALLFSAQALFGQITVRVLNYRPTGEFGFAMKPLITAEISYQRRFEEHRWRPAFSFTYRGPATSMAIPTETSFPRLILSPRRSTRPVH